VVADRHLRRVGKDCLVSFAASLYSTPARRVSAGQMVDVRVSPATVAIHALTAGAEETTLLAVHPRATRRGSWIIDPRHWDGLPEGTRRATTDRVCDPSDEPGPDPVATAPNPLEALLTQSWATNVRVGRRSLATYDIAAGLGRRPGDLS
jgi:hypothetical protein